MLDEEGLRVKSVDILAVGLEAALDCAQIGVQVDCAGAAADEPARLRVCHCVVGKHFNYS